MASGDDKKTLLSRFIRDTRLIITSSWINWLLLLVPVSIILGALTDWAHLDVISPSVIFAINALAIVPLASLLAFATESAASRLGDTVGALMNITFGNAVELIIFIIALVNGQVRIVQAAVIGSILSNLLIILGMSFLLGGLRYQEQLYNTRVSQTSAVVLCLSMLSLLLPTALHASILDTDTADRLVVQVSRGTSIVLLLAYALYLMFSLKSHSSMYESTPQHLIDEEAARPGVLTRFLDSDTSSSSDSDSTHDTRLRRAFRRRRRGSSQRMDSGEPPGVGTHDGITREEDQPTEERPNRSKRSRRRRQSSGGGITGLGSQSENSGPEDRRPEGRTGRSRRPHREKQLAEDGPSTSSPSRHHRREKKRANAPVRSQGQPHESIPMTNLDKAAGADEKRHSIFSNFSNHVTPAFPHHEAVARRLAMPTGGPQTASRSPLRRTEQARSTSMPARVREAESIDGATPRPLQHHDRVAEMSPADILQDDEADHKHHLSKTSSVVLLLITTALVAICADFLVSSLNHLISNKGISQAFLGLIILPLVGNAAEHVTAVTVAYKNKMDLAIGIALGSCIQVALLITPFMVVLGWIIHQDMSLYFSIFEVAAVFAGTIIAGFLLIDGRSNYLEGALLVTAYIVVALAAWFYPNCGLSTETGVGPKC